MDLSNFQLKSTEISIHSAVVFRPHASNKMAIKSKLLFLLLLLILFNLSILVYVMILNRNYLWKIFTEDAFENNKLCRSALGNSAQQGLSDPTDC